MFTLFLLLSLAQTHSVSANPPSHPASLAAPVPQDDAEWVPTRAEAVEEDLEDEPDAKRASNKLATHTRYLRAMLINPFSIAAFSGTASTIATTLLGIAAGVGIGVSTSVVTLVTAPVVGYLAVIAAIFIFAFLFCVKPGFQLLVATPFAHAR